MAQEKARFVPQGTPPPVPEEQVQAEAPGLFRDWAVFTFIGEGLGILLAALVSITASAWLALPDAWLWTALLVAGAAEGALLGFFQARVFHKQAIPISLLRWTWFTAAGAVLAWTGAAIFGILSTLGPLGTVAGGVVAAAGITTLPALQALLLRSWSPHPWRWIPYNVAAWALGFSIVLAAAARVPAADEAARWASGAGGGLVSAIVVALVTATALTRIAPGARPMRPTGPVRVLTPRVVTGFHKVTRFVGRFGLVLILTLLTLALPMPDDLGTQGHRALAAFVFTASILALQPVSLPIAALMVPVALVALGVADTGQAFETFSRPVVFLILGSLFLAEALRKHGLTRRLALYAIRLSGGGAAALLLALMGITAFLSMWIENTATAAMLIPVALTISRQVKDADGARELLILLVLGIAYAASIGGMVTINGSSANAVASSHLAQTQSWTFVDWMVFGGPAAAIVFPLTWFMLLRIRKTRVQRVDLEPVRKQLAEMGPLSRAEKEILATLGVAILFWVAGPSIEAALGLPPSLLSAALVAVMAVSYLAIREIIGWDDLKGVSWGIFLIIGAGLALGEAVIRAGLTTWLATSMGPFVAASSLLLALVVLTFSSALFTNVLNNTTIAAVLVPILIRIAAENPHLDVLYLVLPATLATTFGYSLPSASGRMALIAATGIITPGDMFRYGLVVMLASSAAMALLFFGLSQVGWP